MEVNIKLLYADSEMPKKAYLTDAGFDCTAHHVKRTDTYISYGLGFAVEIPQGYVGLLFPRSSCRKMPLIMANCVGVIDYGYTGEVEASFKITDPYKETYKVGDRVAQLVIMPIPMVTLNVVDELASSERGDNGHGSSGK